MLLLLKTRPQEARMQGTTSRRSKSKPDAISTSVFVMVSLRKNRKATEKRNRKASKTGDCTKLDEGFAKAGEGRAVDIDKRADFTVDNYAALKLKHPQRDICSVPDPTDVDCSSTSEFSVYNALMSFHNSSSAGLDCILPQILNNLIAET